MVTLTDLNDEPTVDGGAQEPELVPLANCGRIIETLSSSTRRSIMAEICVEPQNPASVAERIDTSVQNVLYHLDHLEDAGLVTVIDTHYSEKGHQMDVYAPTSTVIVIDVEGEADSHTENGAPDDDELATTPMVQ